MKNSGWKRLCSLLLCLTMLASLLAGCGGRTAVTEPETPEPAQQTEAEPVQVAAGEREDEPVPVAPQPIAREAIEAALDKAGTSAETLAVTVRSQDLDKVLAELRGADGVEDARPVADNGDTAVIGVTPSPDVDPDLEDLEGVEDVAPADEAEIPLTDLPATWHGERRDEDGNLNVPFDVAYPAAFAQETTAYCQDHLLLRVDKGFDGELNHDLALCGFVSVERFLEKEDFDWYRADLAQGVPIATAIQKARSLSMVLMADYDYVLEAEALEDLGENPRYEEQWYLQEYGIPQAREFLAYNGIPDGGAPGVVVAVIDTGVDYDHPDLKASMWINHGEIAGNGIDDDGNGYVDDVYGINAVTNNGDPRDDHGHGTHVAGILAASNNKEGVVGVAYNAKIMAVKAGQASGVFNQSDIAEAILYAYSNGADVINMSFGGTITSVAVQDALTTAYTRSVLVAAAGNNGKPNEAVLPYYREPFPNYPAAYSYVVGVMSVDKFGTESVFTNWDAHAFNGLEYEVYAPGEGILSTLPGGRYGALNGTSMASPVVAGVAALLRSYYTDRDMYPSRFIAAQLCATGDTKADCFDPDKHEPFHTTLQYHNRPTIVDAHAALTKMPKPDVNLYDFAILDDGGDGVADAGDTLELGLVLRNRWGMSKDTVVTVEARSALGMPDSYVEMLSDSVNLGSVGTYSTRSMLIRDEDQIVTGIENPLRLKIADDCPNDYTVTLHVIINYGNGLDETDGETYCSDGVVTFTVRSGVVKTGQITADETWTKDSFYIVPGNLYIAEGVTVTVEPGTRIQFWSGEANDPYADDTIPAQLVVAGRFVTQGSAEEPVQIFNSELKPDYAIMMNPTATGMIKLNYTEMTNPYITVDYIDHCTFYRDTDLSLVHTAQYSNTTPHINALRMTNSSYSGYSYFGFGGIAQNCVFRNAGCNIGGTATYWNCAWINCKLGGSFAYNHNYIGETCIGKTCQSVGDGGIFYDERFGDHYYCEIEMFSAINISNIGYNGNEILTRDFARSMGGDLLCFETEEEFELFEQAVEDQGRNSNKGAIGLFRGDDTWVNGEPVESWLQEKVSIPSQVSSGRMPLILLSLHGASGVSLESTNKYSTYFMELPLENGQVPDAETLNERLIAFMARYGWAFSGNAILNNLHASPNEWLQVRAGENGGSSPLVIPITDCWWGTTNETIIERMIRDFDDDATLDDLNPYPYLTEAPDDVWPFVADAYLLDHNGERVSTVGNETVVFVVEFNRDMDTDQVLDVRFGAAEPYAEYQVSGSWITPRRWEGVYTLKTTIENGTQYFNVFNGRAADDHWMKLMEVPGRFSFTIDTTEAMAMMMQATATETGVQLTWMQDDYDTLAGYNVYRSTAEDGLYTRLNSSVIPAGEESFFDDTVEPGVLYYYNFTVVLTDMSESTPSGKVSVRAMDTMAPNVYHTPVHTAYLGSNLVINATVTDNLAVNTVTLFYRITGETDYRAAEMTAVNSKYSGLIPAADVTLAGLEYYIEATDGINYTRRGSAEEPYAVTVQQAVDANSKGDVNGDGSITNLDALMILQAINDLLNLTEDQFLRADLNDDGELSAAEALRILKYVSGKVSTILG